MSHLAKIRCHEVTPQLDRRSVLAGIAGLVALTPLTKAYAKDELSLASLVGTDGQVTDLARSVSGQMVRVRGYLAPSLDGREFALSESSPGPCQLCGALHDPGATVTIRPAAGASSPPIFEPVLVQGQLAVIGPTAVLAVVDAKVSSL